MNIQRAICAEVIQRHIAILLDVGIFQNKPAIPCHIHTGCRIQDIHSCIHMSTKTIISILPDRSEWTPHL